MAKNNDSKHNPDATQDSTTMPISDETISAENVPATNEPVDTETISTAEEAVTTEENSANADEAEDAEENSPTADEAEDAEENSPTADEAEDAEKMPVTTEEIVPAEELSTENTDITADENADDTDLLSDESRAWLQALLSTAESDDPESSDDLSAVDLDQSDDAALEKILGEDWSYEENADTDQPEEESAEENAPSDSQITNNTIIFEMPLQEEPEEELPLDPDDEPVRKIRPKRKKGVGLFGIPHILATGIWLALILAIGISMGRVLWVLAADVMAFGKGSQEVVITITENDTLDTITDKLAQAGLVRYPALFKKFAQITGKADDISIGTFTLNTHLDYNAMINSMISYGSARETVDIMFPEGYNCAQIFKLLADKNVCSVEDLEKYAAEGELSNYWFLEGVPRGHKYCLEGYMAPDTYKFYINDDPRRVIEKFLDEFDDRFTDIMKNNFLKMQKQYTDTMRANGLSEDYIAKNPLTLHQVITLASIILKETSSDEECYPIASVFYNRMTHPEYLILGSDATVYYALGDYFGQIGELTDEHLNVDSPYNTRKNKGFPPGPICNMGVHALYSALDPSDTNYYYFVYDPQKGSHLFAATYQEHMNNIAKVEAQTK